MGRKVKTILLFLTFAGFMALIVVGMLLELPNWFGMLLLVYAGLWLWAAHRHWPQMFDLLYGGGSLSDAKEEANDKE